MARETADYAFCLPAWRAEQSRDGVGVDQIGVDRWQQQRIPEPPKALRQRDGQYQDRDEDPWSVDGAARPRHASTDPAHSCSVGPQGWL